MNSCLVDIEIILGAFESPTRMTTSERKEARGGSGDASLGVRRDRREGRKGEGETRRSRVELVEWEAQKMVKG